MAKCWQLASLQEKYPQLLSEKLIFNFYWSKDLNILMYIQSPTISFDICIAYIFPFLKLFAVYVGKVTNYRLWVVGYR